MVLDKTNVLLITSNYGNQSPEPERDGLIGRFGIKKFCTVAVQNINTYEIRCELSLLGN